MVMHDASASMDAARSAVVPTECHDLGGCHADAMTTKDEAVRAAEHHIADRVKFPVVIVECRDFEAGG
jgi:hypothetical protein